MSHSYAKQSSIFAAIILLFLSLMDATLTCINIEKWGIEVEWNPVMRHLIEVYGVWIMFAIKAGFGGILVAMLLMTEERTFRRWVSPVLFCMVGAYSVICFYGYILITS